MVFFDEDGEKVDDPDDVAMAYVWAIFRTSFGWDATEDDP
jgi:hypothetical protein